MATESVKIDTKIVKRIRKHVKTTGQTITGFINISLNEVLQSLEKNGKPANQVNS